ncbi:NADH dehydrogenase (ubiquinone) B17 subunit [Ptiloglossa arizonensis]|uniref:NADH dehydrogenase (ubiquinone) B17 subunit n=1 Tax=Ptiloglossa arizonensis TaxID=3350558 RepID=UPI003FA03334
MAASPTGGVRSINIAGRVASERERLIGMTDEERAWRARYLKSQILAPEEPIILKDSYKKTFNPIRRFYRAPLNVVENSLSQILGATPAFVIRNIIGKSIMGITAIYMAYYYSQYNTLTWMRKSGWKIILTNPATYPGSKSSNIKKPSEYTTRGFEKSPI